MGRAGQSETNKRKRGHQASAYFLIDFIYVYLKNLLSLILLKKYFHLANYYKRWRSKCIYFLWCNKFHTETPPDYNILLIEYLISILIG